MMTDYSDEHFLNDDGSYNQTTCPVRNTESISDLIPEKLDGKIINIGSATLFPPEFFCPLSSDGKTMRIMENTFSIHWFSASWLSKEEMVVHEWRVFVGKCERYLGKNLGKLFARFIYLFMPRKRSVLKRM